MSERSPTSPADHFLPTCSAEILYQRAEIIRSIRSFFDQRGFCEVETPLLSADSVVDRHIDPLPVTLFDDARHPELGKQLWLQTSPEFGMKRLMLTGLSAIYQITKAFRGGEVGALHNPEFTILEWYRAGDDYTAGMNFLAELAQHVLRCDTIDRLSYAEAFKRALGIDPHRSTAAELQSVTQQKKIAVTLNADSDRDAWLNLLLAEYVEPSLGKERPLILFDYPASQAALAQVRSGDPPVAERFELYYRGIELANGYHELLDPQVLRERNRVNNSARAAEGRYQLPEESRLLAAMQAGLPACSGVALGIDRLVMCALGKTSLADVMPFPIQRA